MKDYSEHETLTELVTDQIVQLECAKCDKKYWVTNEVARAVDAGKEDNICYYCTGEHAPEGEDR